MNVFLIRHGETQWNLDKMYCSYTDIGLTERGVRQAENVKNILKPYSIGRIYSSDLKRAYEFAGAVFFGRKIEKHKELQEINFGDFEALSSSEIDIKFNDIYRKWLVNPMEADIPNGERLLDFSKRILNAVSKIIENAESSSIAIVSHAGPIGVLVCDALAVSLSEMWRHKPDNGGVVLIEVLGEKRKVHKL